MKQHYYELKEVNGKQEVIWRKGRSQGLEGAKGRVGNISKDIKDLLKKGQTIRILEIGCGFGRALLELKQIFGNKIEIYGTNFEKDCNKALIKKYALSQKLFSEQNVDENLPEVYILDAGKKLPFDDESFDFVFCQATMQYIEDKVKFIEEANRLLTKNGQAVLELQEFRDDHPEEYQDMIEILNKDKKVDFLKYLKKFKNINIKKSIERSWHYAIMKKVDNFSLNLKLIKVIDLEKISDKYWGKKSIYSV